MLTDSKKVDMGETVAQETLKDREDISGAMFLKYWPITVFLLTFLVSTVGAYYTMNAKLQEGCAKIVVIEEHVEEIPNKYVTREILDIKLQRIDEKLQDQSSDLRDIKNALGVK